MFACVEEVLLIRWIATEIDFPQGTTIIQQDNKLIVSGEVELTYQGSVDIIADGAAKGKIGKDFLRFANEARNTLVNWQGSAKT